MTTIVKIDAVPGVHNPVEGVDYNIIAGDPAPGDAVRITTASGTQVFESCYALPVSVPAQLDQSTQRRAMVLGRAAELDKKGQYSQASALRATIGE